MSENLSHRRRHGERYQMDAEAVMALNAIPDVILPTREKRHTPKQPTRQPA